MLHSVRFEPPPAEWEGLIDRREDCLVLGKPLRQWQRATRQETLGLDCSRVIATGHQSGLWHPGILAKYLAMDAGGDSFGADALVELVVDQDLNDLRSIRIPAVDSEGVLVAAELPWSHWPVEEEPRPTGVQPPLLAEPSAWRLREQALWALGWQELHARAMGRALMLTAASRTRAEQFALAAALLREVRFANRELPSIGQPVVDRWHHCRFQVLSSNLRRTSIWDELMTTLKREPRLAWETYNMAATRFPDAGIAPLEDRTSAGCEIPCWLITSDGHRHRAFEHDLHRTEAVLWPRALLTTGLVRLALADLFIHGLGGQAYDQVTREWFRNWLGCNLAPDVMVTATLTLEFDREPADERDLARAHWLAHHVPFNVDRFLDDSAPLRERTRLLREIDALPRRSPGRRALFEEMRSHQRRLAAEHPDLLESAHQGVRHARRRMGEKSIVSDRTWPFALYPHGALQELERAIRRAFEFE